MIDYSILEINFKIVNDIYEIDYITEKSLSIKYHLTINDLFNSIKNDMTFYVDKLDLFYIYLLDYLLKHNFTCVTTEKLKNNEFSFALKDATCSNIVIKLPNCKIRFINFKSKFGIEYNDEYATDLILYAQKKDRMRMSLGSDAYTDFLKTIFYRSQDAFAGAKKIRETFPELDLKVLKYAKENVSGYQFFKPGIYNNIYEYDITSSYCAQLLNNHPVKMPHIYKNIEEVPHNYFKIIKFTYYDLEVKETAFNWLNLDKMGILILTEKLFELFKHDYNCKIIIKEIYAFKTCKSIFKKFINQNIIEGKQKEKNKYIAKYNKLIGNSIVGYFGKNTESYRNIVTMGANGLEIKRVNVKLAPIYLPVYLAVLDHAKYQFIKTIRKYKDKIIYANTDGFLATEPIPLEELNFNCSLSIGTYRLKNIYKDIYIKGMNEYAGITEEGEIKNTISGIKLTRKITPEEFKNKKISYVLNIPTKDGKFKKSIIN